MEGRNPVSRRRARSWRITAAVGVLGVATLAVAGALVTGDLFVVGGAGVFALAGGWVALRLAWSGIVQSRFENAVDRAELARTYRKLFADRSVEHELFVARMSGRLAERDRRIDELRVSLVRIEMRAVEAETTVTTFRRQLGVAEGRIASMEELIAAARQARAEARAQEPTPVAVTRRAPLLRRRKGPLRESVVPEWADLESDAMAALVAWEEHANHVAGRHSADERPAQQA